MLEIIKMTFYRIFQHKIYLLMSIFVTPIVVFGAIFFTNNIETVKASIAILEEENTTIISTKEVKVTRVKEKPEFAELVQGKYDAFLIPKEDGTFEIETVKGEAFQNKLKSYLQGNEDSFKEKQRGVATNFIGFVTLFILIFCSMLYKFYYSEKEGINKRIIATKVGFIKYALSHAIVVFSIVFVPAVLTVFLARATIGFQTTVSNLQMVWVLFVLSFLGTAFNLFISAVIKTEANGSLVGAMVIVITTLMAGSIFDITAGGVANQISNIFPQHTILAYVAALESGMPANLLSMFGILAFSLILSFIGITIDRIRIEENY
ncbi:MAG: ABC transporter permease [Clostridia bacterium]